MFPPSCWNFLRGFKNSYHQNGLNYFTLIQMYFCQLLTLSTYVPVTENQFLCGFFHSVVRWLSKTSVFYGQHALVFFILMEQPHQIQVDRNVFQKNVFSLRIHVSNKSVFSLRMHVSNKTVDAKVLYSISVSWMQRKGGLDSKNYITLNINKISLLFQSPTQNFEMAT